MQETEATTRVTILGEEFQVRGAERDMVLEVAALVDGKFRELQTARPTMDLKRLAVMVCLNMAAELQSERAVHGKLIRQASEQARRCRESLEVVPLEGDDSEAGPRD
jgi:cell division protein ZapA (FtsZ GTPase activity inhibitor)